MLHITPAIWFIGGTQGARALRVCKRFLRKISLKFDGQVSLRVNCSEKQTPAQRKKRKVSARTTATPRISGRKGTKVAGAARNSDP